MPDMSPEIAAAIGRIPSGCSILTVRTDDERSAMLVSWVQQASFTPPVVSVAVNADRPVRRLIEEARGFVLNLLGTSPAAMFRHFGRGFEPGDDAFAGIPIEEVEFGVSIADQIAWLSCKLSGSQTIGDHVVYFGEVVAASADAALPAPYVHVRRSGGSY